MSFSLSPRAEVRPELQLNDDKVCQHKRLNKVEAHDRFRNFFFRWLGSYFVVVVFPGGYVPESVYVLT